MYIKKTPKDSVIIFVFNSCTYFKDPKRKKVLYIYPDIYYFCCSFLFLADPDFSREFTLAFLIKQVFWNVNSPVEYSDTS